MARQKRLLKHIGFEEAEAMTVLDETIRKLSANRPSNKYQSKFAANSMRLIGVAGLDRHAATRDSLMRGGWLPERPQA